MYTHNDYNPIHLHVYMYIDNQFIVRSLTQSLANSAKKKCKYTHTHNAQTKHEGRVLCGGGGEEREG